MKRRQFLGGLVGASSLLSLRQTRRSGPLQIRYWLSENAADFDVNESLQPYLEAALAPVFEAPTISFGGTVQVSTEDGHDVTNSGEWPLRVFTEAFDLATPSTDVYLLVTDGALGPTPPGMARGPFASLGGASALEAVPPRNELPEAVEISSPLYAMQLALHEVGHALGLDHEHGSIEAHQDGKLASPMVSGYAWGSASEKFTATRCRCGNSYPIDRSGIRYLSFSFSSCARDALRSDSRSH